MKITRLAPTNLEAKNIWSKRTYFKLENFALPDILKTHLSQYPDSKIQSRRNHLRSFAKYFHDHSINEISTSKLNEWFMNIQNDQSLSDRTLFQIRSQLNILFKWLEDEQILQNNPLKKIKFKRNTRPKRMRVLFEQNELMQLLGSANTYDPENFYPFLYAIIQTGARRSEIMRLTWKDYNSEKSTVSFTHTKNGESRTIHINQNLKSVIENQNRLNKHIFSNRHGNSLGRGKVQRMINDFKKRHPDFGNWNYHDLRHSFAYNFLSKGGEMYQLQAILGHKTIQMTVDLYGNFKSQNVKNPSPYSF